VSKRKVALLMLLSFAIGGVSVGYVYHLGMMQFVKLVAEDNRRTKAAMEAATVAINECEQLAAEGVL